MWWFLVPIIILGSLVVLFGLVVVLGRFRNGIVLRAIVTRLSRIGFMRRFFTKLTTAAVERQNPELASAMRKLNTVASNPNPQAVQKAMSRLTPAERRAYLQATETQNEESAPNRQARRQVERMQQQARGPSRSGGGSSRKRKRR
jgi:hypothetical protein